MSDKNTTAKNIFGAGSWAKKNRYEEEEFAFSPPDESGFLPVRFGINQPKPNESMYDRINKELGICVETSSNVLKNDGVTPILTYSGGKFTLQTQPHNPGNTISLVTQDSSENPRIIIPPTITERRESNFSIEAFELETSRVAKENAETLVTKARSGRPTRKTSMNLEGTYQDNTSQNISTPIPEHNNPPFKKETTPFAEAAAIAAGITQERTRKTSAPTSLNPLSVEKSSNFYFTGGLFSSISSTSASTFESSEAPNSLMSTTSPMAIPKGVVSQSAPSSPKRTLFNPLAFTTQKLDEQKIEAAALEVKANVSKRRPKPSALREMNFLAPQSM